MIYAASAGGLQDLLDVCSNFAKLDDIVFNYKMTVGMIFFFKGYVHVYALKYEY